jgi:anaerobic magnesium-protoporphyrin IX monomethyl ester cyclase
MEMTLITPCPADIAAYGVRALSAYVKKNSKHKVNLILLPGGIEMLAASEFAEYQYPQHVLDQVTEICKNSGFVGFSFMTHFFDRAVNVTQHLQKTLPKAHLCWGGTHPTIKPEEALNFVDSVCLGEAEESLLELLNKMEAGTDYRDVQNFWFKKNNNPSDVIMNDRKPLMMNLDDVPTYDYELDGHYLFDHLKGEVIPMDSEVLRRASHVLPYFDNKLLKSYRTMTCRGCPHRCNYCSNSWLRDMYAPQAFLRHRSVDHCIAELVDIKKKFPWVEIIQFFDDTFFAQGLKRMEDFSKKYKEQVGLPFYCQASPATVSDKKMELLLDAGMCYVEMGLQTGSDRIQTMYDRKMPREQIMKAAQSFGKYAHHLIPPTYHLIIDNPWETNEDILETVDVLTELPRPFNVVLSSLEFYPATALLERAKKEGIVTDEMKQVYRQPFLDPKPKYLNAVLYASQYGTIPNPLMKFLTTQKVIKAMDRPALAPLYNLAFRLTDWSHLINRGRCAVMAGEFDRIIKYFKRVK